MLREIKQYIDGLKHTQKRIRIDLQKGWLFSDNAPPDASGPSCDDSHWELVDLPHDYSALQGFHMDAPSGLAGGYVRTGVVWYRKHFDCTGMDNRLLTIHFDGVASNSRVYINGHFLGQYPSPFTPFHYDITPYARLDDSNVLAVMCDTSLQPYSRFYIGTGLYREVFLTATDSLHILPQGVSYRISQADNRQAVIDVETELAVNAFPDTVWTPFGASERPVVNSTRDCTLVINLVDNSGRVVAQQKEIFPLTNYSKRRICQSITLEEPMLWAPQTPCLYRIQALLYAGDELCDDTLTPMGVRTLGWNCEEGIFLNGRPFKIKGVCMHQDISPYGGATTVEAWVRRIEALQEMGCNSIRTSHNPFPSIFYHVCDYMGMTVMDEAFDEWCRGWDRELEPRGKNEYGYYLYFNQWYETDLTNMIRRDRIHPSVVMWSFGNEIPELYFEESVSILQSMQALAKALDNTRPTIVAAEGNYNLPLNEEAMGVPDIAGFNYIDIRYGERYYDDIHDRYPALVLCGSETSMYPEAWVPVRDNSYVVGQYIWAAFDYLGEAADFTQIPISSPTLSAAFMSELQNRNAADKPILHGWPNCLLNCINGKKPEYYLRKCLWNDTPTCKLAVGIAPWTRTGQWNTLPAMSHWNWEEGRPVAVYCLHNCETIELVLNGEPVALPAAVDSLTPVPIELTFHEGTLELIGLREGVEVCRDRLVTAYEPAEIHVLYDKEALGVGELTELSIEIVDRYGTLVPVTDAPLTIAVGGGGEFATMATGNLYDSTPYSSRTFVPYGGRCLAVIRVKTAEDIRVEISYGRLSKVFCLHVPAEYRAL